MKDLENETSRLKTKKNKNIETKLSYDELLKFYKHKKQSFTKTKYFKRRLYLSIGFLFLILLALPMVPPSETEIGIFGYIMSVAFLAIIVLVDQLFLGLYLFKSEKKIS